MCSYLERNEIGVREAGAMWSEERADELEDWMLMSQRSHVVDRGRRSPYLPSSHAGFQPAQGNKIMVSLMNARRTLSPYAE
jgi:hypothetical protein